MILNFFVEKKIQTVGKHSSYERNLKQIALINFRTEFLFDLVTVLPLYEMMKGLGDKSKYLLLIKAVRIKKGISAFNAQIYIKQFRLFSMARLQEMIDKNRSAALNKRKDNTLITHLVYSLQILKIVESFVWLVSLSFVLGVFWIIICELELDL